MPGKRGRPLGSASGGEKKVKRQIYLDAALMARVWEYAKTFPIRVSETAIFEAAIREFLDRSEKRGDK